MTALEEDAVPLLDKPFKTLPLVLPFQAPCKRALFPEPSGSIPQLRKRSHAHVIEASTFVGSAFSFEASTKKVQPYLRCICVGQYAEMHIQDTN
jgi:hypothetical protein